MPTTLEFVREARSCVNTPYKDQHRAKGIGMDCLGLVWHTAETVGCDLQGFTPPPYGQFPDSDMLIEVLDKYLLRVWRRVDEPLANVCKPRVFQPYLHNGDVLVLGWGETKRPKHLAVAAVSRNGWNLIQALSSAKSKEYPRGRVVEHGLDEQWAGRVTHVYRFRDIL